MPTNQPSGEPAWNGPPRTPPPVGQRIVIGICWPERQCVLAATVTIGSKAQVMKSANWSSTTGRSPIQAAPIAAPTKPSSEIGVSITRSSPNSSWRPGGDAEGAAEDADVLAEQEDAVVLAHRVLQRGADRLEVGDLADGGRVGRPARGLEDGRRSSRRGAYRSRLGASRMSSLVAYRCGVTRDEALERLRATLAAGRPIIGAGAGTGLSAKCEEAGGVDLIIVYNSGRYRMAGRGSAAGLLAYGDANAIVVEMAAEVLPVVADTPVLAGVNGTDPFRSMPRFLARAARLGFSGVQNFPTVGVIDGNFRQVLEETGMSFRLEVEMIRAARELDLLTTPYAFDPQEARWMADAGADVVVAHMNTTTKGLIGVTSAPSLDEAVERVQAIADAAYEVNPDVLVLCHGGPIAEPEDAQYVLERTAGVVGFYGASSMERLPVETAIAENAQQVQAAHVHAALTLTLAEFGVSVGEMLTESNDEDMLERARPARVPGERDRARALADGWPSTSSRARRSRSAARSSGPGSPSTRSRSSRCASSRAARREYVDPVACLDVLVEFGFLERSVALAVDLLEDAA